MVNLVEHKVAAADGRQADPEVQAGRALRQLRLARDWSQEEVAVRMTAYGYDFHQTTIAKIEAARRPLRVRELADFAALYGVEVQDLVYPPSRTLPEIDYEIADLTTRLEKAQADASAAIDQLERARTAMRDAEAAHQASVAEVAALEGRLASLSADREKVASLGSEPEPYLAGSGDEAEQGPAEPVVAPITSTARGGPTVLRVLLGAHLRRLREAAGITMEAAAYAIRSSNSKISRLEAGRLGFKLRDLSDLLNLYGVTEETDRQALLELARQSNAPGWWHDYSDILPSWFEAYIELEMAATTIRIYEARSVPELLQTEDYARALTAQDHRNISPGEIERRVRLRTARQANILNRPNPPRLWVLLDEAALRRQVGGPEVMRDQLKRLIEIARQQPNATIQLVPLEGAGGSAGGSFSILRFAERDLSDFVYVEQLASALYLDNRKDVEVYLEAMEILSMRALALDKTSAFLRKLLAMNPLGTDT
jgi:transcriptional regulator with XRE-family HTH domain